MKNCIINCGIGAWYPRGSSRLMESIINFNFDGDLMFYNKYPTGSPTHQQVPYAFKVYMFLEAKNSGYKNVLWLDSSFWAIKNLNEVFNYIENNGWLLQKADHNVGTWSSDKSINGFGLSREDAFKIEMFSGGMIGLNFSNEKANEFLNRLKLKAQDGFSFVGSWKNTNLEVSKDNRVQGHRHDMSVGSVIANNLEMNMVKNNTFFSYYGWYMKYKDDINFDTSKVCLLAQGM